MASFFFEAASHEPSFSVSPYSSSLCSFSPAVSFSVSFLSSLVLFVTRFTTNAAPSTKRGFAGTARLPWSATWLRNGPPSTASPSSEFAGISTLMKSPSCSRIEKHLNVVYPLCFMQLFASSWLSLSLSLSLSFTICALLVHGIILSSISLCCIRATSTVARIPENTVYPFFRAHSSTLSSLPIPLCSLFSRFHVSLLLSEHRDSLKLFTRPARGRLWSNGIVGDARDPLGRSSGFPGSFYSGVSLRFKTCNTSLLSQGHWTLSSLDRQIETTIASRQI